MTSATGLMNNQDIMAYLRQNGSEIREIIDSVVKDGYERTIKAFRAGPKEDKIEAQKFLSQTIEKHKKQIAEEQGKARKTQAKPRTQSYMSRVANSAPVQRAVSPSNITQTGPNIKGMGQGIVKTGKGLAHTGQAVGYGVIGPVQFGANALGFIRKTFGVSDLVWNTASAAVIAGCLHYAFVDKVDMTTGEYASTIETHNDDFCADRTNLHGDGLTAIFSRAHYAPDDNTYPHYLGSLDATKVDMPPVMLMMIQAMETAFRDVRGSRPVTTINNNRILVDADAQGPYQVQRAPFLEMIRDHVTALPFYQDLQQDVENGTASTTEKMTLTSIDKMLNRVRGRSGDQIQNIANDLNDGTVIADEQIVLDLRNNPAFMTQLVGEDIKNRYPELRLSRLPSDPMEQLNAIQDGIHNIYQDHLMGEYGAQLYDRLADITGLRISDTATAQQYMNSFGNPYELSANHYVRQAQANPGPFANFDRNTTFADGLGSFIEYVDNKTDMVTSPMAVTAAQISGQISSAFNVCVSDINTPDGQVIRKTRAQIAADNISNIFVQRL